MAQKVNIELLKKTIIDVNPRIRNINFNSTTDLFEQGILDSFSVIQLVNTFEEKFGIVFEYGDLKAAYFRNLDSLMGILVSKYKVPEGKNLPGRKKKAAKKAAKKAKNKI